MKRSEGLLKDNAGKEKIVGDYYSKNRKTNSGGSQCLRFHGSFVTSKTHIAAVTTHIDNCCSALDATVDSFQ